MISAGDIFSSKQTSEKKLPPPSPEAIHYRRMFTNAVLPQMMKLAGFRVEELDSPRFMGYADTEKQKKFTKGETEKWTGKGVGGKIIQEPAKRKLRERFGY